MKVGTGSTESSDFEIDECLSIDYQPKEGEPGLKLKQRTKVSGYLLPVELEQGQK